MKLGRGHAQRAEAQQTGFPGVAGTRQPVRVVLRVHRVREQRRAALAPLVVGLPQNQGIHEKRPRHVCKTCCSAWL